ncbi:hypothetical protein FBUS_05036 [Fasciolopsis buskii]|uniref:Uncharacterized protein n=1 Tax=Fasciolopsis buskii TaxID=27845 RepID=A0A8E0VI42_9TREM|nr:hypothetical protein FBUS_05036 [Fasciolopsis buski]
MCLDDAKSSSLTHCDWGHIGNEERANPVLCQRPHDVNADSHIEASSSMPDRFEETRGTAHPMADRAGRSTEEAAESVQSDH